MNRKILGIALLALMVAAAGAFASGDKETQSDGPGFYGPGSGWCPGYANGPGRGRGLRGGASRGPWQDERFELKFGEDKVTVTGPVYFENRMHAELKAGGKDYELMVPRFYLYDAELKEGQQVTVEGYLAQGDEENYLWVTKAVFDGKEFELERGFGRGPRRAWGPGRMGRRW